MRLRDYDENDPELLVAARLTRAADPGEPGPFLQQKVAASLHGARRKVAVPRFAITLGVLLAGAFAFAGTTAWRAHEARVRREAQRSEAAHRDRARAMSAAPVIAPEAAPIEETPEPKASEPIATPRVHRHAAPIASPIEPEPATAPAIAPTPDATSDALLLQRVVRAWKHDHDAKAAAALADEHLRRFPNSDLREEAFSVSMSAHEALTDGLAPTIARRYVDEFTTGRFITQAAALLP